MRGADQRDRPLRGGYARITSAEREANGGSARQRRNDSIRIREAERANHKHAPSRLWGDLLDPATEQQQRGDSESDLEITRDKHRHQHESPEQ